MPIVGPPAGVTPLSVSQLNARIRETLEANLRRVWVVGEISNFKLAPSGHFYFALKDKRSQLAAVMFRSANQVLPFRPTDGLEVIVSGHVGIYETRGDLQLYVEQMEPRGVGSMQLALEQLKQRLAAAGLFASERKRALPFFPRTVGIVTALKGAAVHDMLTILRQRMPSVRIIVRPVRVQGTAASVDIAQALSDVCALGYVDVVIVGRGGGSLEDLWAFNDERVALAIAGCPVPVVSAVGHEIDTTIADLVADCRAPTPTAAAAMVVPDRRELRQILRGALDTLQRAMARSVRVRREHLALDARRLRDPRQTLRHMRLRLDELSDRAQRAIRLHDERERQRLRAVQEQLQALSPLSVLQRGYSIATRTDNGSIVRRAADLKPGDDLNLRLAEGSASVRVI